jgi:hypothetical protein
MSGPKKRSLHPLLLDQDYWHNRLQELRMTRQSVLLVPRPELSSEAVIVDEFRLKAHDGVRLFGLRAKCRFSCDAPRATVRVVGPSDLPEIDRRNIERGETVFVLQEQAGRKLEDRVLDVLRVCQLASSMDLEHPPRVELESETDLDPRDEFLIASQLLAGEGKPELPLDDGAGWPSR